MGRRHDPACRELVELRCDHLDGTLDARAAARVEQHLLGCGDCGRYADQLQQTLAPTRGLAVEECGGTVPAPGLVALPVELRRRTRGSS